MKLHIFSDLHDGFPGSWLSGPNPLRVADITYAPTATGFLSLAVVLDVRSRKIVGWLTANHLRTELVLDAMKATVGQSRPKNVIKAIGAASIRQALQ